jgi:hypothetical protein
LRRTSAAACALAVRPLNQRQIMQTNNMKQGRFLLTVRWLIVVPVFAVVPLLAQDTTDFSGHWALESASPSAADIPRVLSVTMSVVRTNVRGEPMNPFFKDITVAGELANGTSSQTYQIGVVGGTVGGRGSGRSDFPSSHRRVAWEKQTLVIETARYTGPTPESGQWHERREVWSYDPDGRLRLAITSRSSGSASSTITLVYRRQ